MIHKLLHMVGFVIGLSFVYVMHTVSLWGEQLTVSSDKCDFTVFFYFLTQDVLNKDHNSLSASVDDWFWCMMEFKKRPYK